MNLINQIRHYYDTSQWLYQTFCYSPNTLGMHFGFWNKSTHNRQEAILNENKTIIDLANIKAHHRILDAGCGVGGTAIYIAKHTGAHVTGITISRLQVRLAQTYAFKHGVNQLTKFTVQDFTQTYFPDNYFDFIYGIESICHASPKSAFLKEAHRLLKSKGKLIIADGYLARKPIDDYEKRLISEFKRSFALKEFVTCPQMTQALTQSGFISIKTLDKTAAVKPSVDHFYRLTRIVHLFDPLLIHISPLQPLRRNFLALYCAGKFNQLKLAKYYVHVARRP